MSEAGTPAGDSQVGKRDKVLFWGCFIGLVATAFGFVVRGQVINDWGTEFNLTETQKGEIFGVGLWPFAVSIVLFSLVIDKIGYGKAMIFAFLCHVVSAIVTIFATGYWSLYIGTLIVALGNGTVEAVVNPVVATMFPREKTKWLTILHAGWPGGLVLGGILAIMIGGWDWKWKVALILIPTVTYGVLMLGRRFPIHERVAAGISYKDMLRELGGLGALIVLLLIFGEVGRVFGVPWHYSAIGAVAIAATFGFYVGALGRPMFIFLLIIMVPLATTELGTDSWITALMEGQMTALGLHAGWVLVYTSLIMMVLRFYAGPIIHKFSPLGLLAGSAVVAVVGLFYLSTATGLAILTAATIYGFGKSFFWPAMLGIVAEQFPKGGALTLNTIAGVGMLGVGVVGNPFLGNIQDREMVALLTEEEPDLAEELVAKEEQLSIFGNYRALDKDTIARITNSVALYEQRQQAEESLQEANGESPAEDAVLASLAEDPQFVALVQTAYNNGAATGEANKEDVSYEKMVAALQADGLFVTDAEYQQLKATAETIDEVTSRARKGALAKVAIFPGFMFVCYMVLIFYFRSKGGYRPQMLSAEEEDSEGSTMEAERSKEEASA